MTSPLPAPPFTVVVAVDFSPSSDRALGTARTLCALSGGGRLYAVHVVPQVELSNGISASPSICAGIEAAQVAQARVRLATSAPLAGLPERIEVTVHVQTGVAHEVITELARDRGADLIVVGTRGLHGIRRMVASSVSERVTRDAPCSVITVRPRELTAAEKIRDHRHEPHAHTYLDLGDAMRGPIDSFSL